MYFVYILKSLSRKDAYYVGFTTDLDSRLAIHNRGEVSATAPGRPWAIKTFLAFADRSRALAFEKYLKTHSGRAFSIKRL